MLFILIPIAWLAVVILFMAICQMAARGDAESVPRTEQPSPSMLASGVFVWEQEPVPLVQVPWAKKRTGVLSRALGVRAHGVR